MVLLLEKIIAKNGIVADIANYLKRLFCSNVSDNIAKYLFLIGTIAITFKMWKFTYRNIMNWSWLPKHLWNARNFTALKFREKYGHCRVLITGFTEGIGWAFAEVFADYGHNLLLISRNS